MIDFRVDVEAHSLQIAADTPVAGFGLDRVEAAGRSARKHTKNFDGPDPRESVDATPGFAEDHLLLGNPPSLVQARPLATIDAKSPQNADGQRGAVWRAERKLLVVGYPVARDVRSRRTLRSCKKCDRRGVGRSPAENGSPQSVSAVGDDGEQQQVQSIVSAVTGFWRISMQPRPVGSTLSGFRRQVGSNRVLKRPIISSVSEVNSFDISSIFSMPTPCSPVMEPPTEMQ